MRGLRSPRAHAWSPARHAWRSAWGHRRGQALALVAISALITACTAFAPAYDRAMQQALVDTLLAQASPADATVTLISESDDFAGGLSDSRDPREVASLIPDEVADRLGPVVLGRTSIVSPTTGEVPPSGLLLWRDGFCEHVRVLGGSCPTMPGEIMVSEADAENFDLQPGSVLKVGSAIADAPDIRLEVVGTYAPETDTWWQGQRTIGISGIVRGLDPSANHDAWLTVEQTFVDASMMTAETSQAGAPVLTGTADVDGVLDLGDGVREIADDLDIRGEDLALRTGLDELTDDVRTQVAQAHRTVPLLLAPMALLSVFVLWLVLSAATSARRGEVAVARLRGRGPTGAAGLLLLELLPALLVGVLPGALVALAGGAVVRRLLPGSSPFEAGPGFGTALVLAVAAIVVTALAAAVRTAREPLHDVVRSGPVASSRWGLGAVEAFVVACVGTGVVAFATGSLRGPLALAGPALMALLTGLLLAHLAAPAGRALGRRLLGRGRLVAGTGLLETGRRAEGRTVIVVVTVACALAVFSMDALAIGERNRSNASKHDAGAPVVLQVAGGDLDGVRSALAEADTSGERATPVLAGRDVLAVDPDVIRGIAFFPRGGPTTGQWQAIAPPDREPVELTGTRISLEVLAGDGLASGDIFGSEVEVRLGLVVTSATGLRRTLPLGVLPSDGSRQRLTGHAEACADGCRLAALQLTTAQGAVISGELGLADLRVDGREVAWASSTSDWNTTDGDDTLIQPLAAADGVLRLAVEASGFYPVEVSPAWVPATVPALLTDRPTAPSPEPLLVTGVDGTDRPAEAAGDLVLVPSMPDGSALVDLDTATRGASITRDTRLEVWLDDDPELEAAVRSALEERDISLTDVRRYAAIRQAYDDTVASWSLSLGAAVAPAVMLLALLVLLVLAVIGWRSRARDLAVLRLNGVDRRTTRRLAVWAQLPAVLLAVAGGVAAGLGGALLAMPDVAFFPAPPDTPVVDTATSWPVVLVVAVTCLVVLPAVAALTGLVVARQAHVERVREGA